MRMNKFPTHLELLTSVSVEISAFRGNTYLYILFPYFLSNRMFPARVRTRPKPGCFPRKRGQLEGGVPESGGRSLSFDRNRMCRRADEQTNRATTRQAQPSRDRPELWYTQTVNQHRKRVSPKDCFETVPETKSTPTCILGILGGPWHDSVRCVLVCSSKLKVDCHRSTITPLLSFQAPRQRTANTDDTHTHDTRGIRT